MLEYLEYNDRHVDWDEFYEWADEVRGKKGYEWVVHIIDEYKEDMPQIVADYEDYYGEDYENGSESDWDEWPEYNATLTYGEKKRYADWGFYDENDKSWNRNPDGKLDMQQLATWIEENRYQIDPTMANKFFDKYATQINWPEFDVWAKEVYEKDGYEWLKVIDKNGPESKDFMLKWKN